LKQAPTCVHAVVDAGALNIDAVNATHGRGALCHNLFPVHNVFCLLAAGFDVFPFRFWGGTFGGAALRIGRMQQPNTNAQCCKLQAAPKD
jgi:hypothetical protein